jgi:hypothetical protein
LEDLNDGHRKTLIPSEDLELPLILRIVMLVSSLKLL